MRYCGCGATTAAAVAVGFVVVARLLLASVGKHSAAELSPLEVANVSLRIEDPGLVGSASSEEPKAASSSRIETLWAHADDETSGGSSRCLVVVVPGAPGLGVLYAGLLHSLAAEQRLRRPAQPPCTSLALSYPREPTAPAELEVVTAAIAAALRTVLTDERWSGGVTVLAQSMGSWFVLRALAVLQESQPTLLASDGQLRGVELITPFLDPRSSGRGPSAGWLLPKLQHVAPLAERWLPELLTPRQLGKIVMAVQWLRGKDPDMGMDALYFYEAIGARLGEGVVSRTLALASEAIVDGKLGPLHDGRAHPREMGVLIMLARQAKLAYQLARGDMWTTNFDDYHSAVLAELSNDAEDARHPPPPVHVHDVRHGFPQVSAHCRLVATAVVADMSQLGWLE